jgi:hypothetical protein
MHPPGQCKAGICSAMETCIKTSRLRMLDPDLNLIAVTFFLQRGESQKMWTAGVLDPTIEGLG